MGQLIPHFDISDIDGRHVNYGADLWQRKHLVLVSAPAVPATLLADLTGLSSDDVAVVVTPGPLPGYPASPIAIVDRWGEVAHRWNEAPSNAEEVGSWLEHVQMRCPECEGETK
jgi:hypothetical protein